MFSQGPFGGGCEGGSSGGCGKLQDDNAASAVEHRAKRESDINLLRDLLLSGRAKKTE